MAAVKGYYPLVTVSPSSPTVCFGMTELRVFTTSIMGNVPAAFYWALGILFLVGIGGIYLNRLRGSSGSSVNPDKNACRYWGRSVARLLLVEWIILVLGMAAIFRGSSAERSINLVPLSSYFDYGENSYFMEKVALNILNVALFVPVGFLLGCGFRNLTWKRALAVGAILSVFIELLQLISRRGLCEVDDVMHNVVGCMIGYGLYKLAALFIMKAKFGYK